MENDRHGTLVTTIKFIETHQRRFREKSNNQLTQASHDIKL